MTTRILIVEDESVCAGNLRDMLLEAGFTAPNAVCSGPDAIVEAGRTPPDLVLMDMRIKGPMDGIEAAGILRERFNIPVVYVTTGGGETLQRAKDSGPHGYIVKPYTKAALQASIEIALHNHRSARTGTLPMELPEPPDAPPHNRHGRSPGTVIVLGEQRGVGHHSEAVHHKVGYPLQANPLETSQLKTSTRDWSVPGLGDFPIVAASPAMQKMFTLARRVAESEARTILLEGETGTGKDVIARFMHHCGKRKDRPFVPLNCAAIPETLLESEFFGYEAGAFTDARNPKPGILEKASGGTIFLDEIGEMPVVLQAKMLRVLDEQIFRRLGGLRDIHVDVRVVAASNCNLARAIEQGRFRPDLYYRLNVVRISLPPLRQRKEGILPLARYFIQHYNQKFKRNVQGLTTGAATAILDHDWPGNVRELRNRIERAVLLEDLDWLGVSSLCFETAFGGSPLCVEELRPDGTPANGTIEAAEKLLLIEALEEAGWNRGRAAKRLGICRDTLRHKMKRYNVPLPAGILDNGGTGAA